MEMQTEVHGDVAVVNVSGRLDITTAPLLETALKPIIEGETRALVVCLRGVDYVSSAGLRVLVSCARALKHDSRPLFVTAVQPYVHEVFEVAGLLEVFNLARDNDEALQALTAN